MMRYQYLYFVNEFGGWFEVEDIDLKVIRVYLVLKSNNLCNFLEFYKGVMVSYFRNYLNEKNVVFFSLLRELVLFEVRLIFEMFLFCKKDG